MKDIKYVNCDELPKGEKEFWLIRQNQELNLILEFYERKGEYDWDSECIYVFEETPCDKELVLKKAKSIIKKYDILCDILYIEEDTFWD